MAIRNILDTLGDGSHTAVPKYFSQVTITWTGAAGVSGIQSTITYVKVDKLCLINISGFTMPNVSYNLEFISDSTIPTEIDIPAAQKGPSFVHISNGVNTGGVAYIGTDSKIHISGDMFIPTGFYVGATNAGLPNGGKIMYTSSI